MSTLELTLLAVGLSMDAFAVAVCIGLTIPKITVKKAIIAGLYFGVFQAVMPIIGYYTARLFAERVTAYSSLIAFVLLCFIGGKMILDSFKKEDVKDEEYTFKIAQMLPLAIATSIDALAVGVSFTFLDVNLFPAVLIIGITTFTLSIVGLKIGNIFGIRFKTQAQILGGIILILLGLKILLDGIDISHILHMRIVL